MHLPICLAFPFNERRQTSKLSKSPLSLTRPQAITNIPHKIFSRVFTTYSFLLSSDTGLKNIYY